MKNTLTKIACFAFVAAALIAAPAATRAADSTNAPAKQAPPARKHGLPIHGSVAAVDTNAMTFTTGNTTIGINSETKIFKDGKPAIFEDIAVGQRVNGYYLKDEAGKNTATMVKIMGPKPAPAPKPAAKPDEAAKPDTNPSTPESK